MISKFLKLMTERTSLILVVTGFIFLTLGVVFFLWMDTNFETDKQINATKFGQFGDFIGGVVGSIWALVGVILFYIALTEQREDIRINRDVLKTQVNALEQQIREFELQRQELEETRKVFQEQSVTQKIQRFENTFFQLLRTHNEIVSSMDLRKIGDMSFVIASGRDCFHNFYKSFQEIIRKKQSPRMDIVAEYLQFYNQEQADLGHYFRSLYHIIKYVHKSDIVNKKQYTNFARAQLSSYELVMLYYNGLSVNGLEKFKPLIEEYSLLKNLPQSILLHKHDLEVYYDAKAFQ